MVKVTLLLDPLQGAALKGDLAPECARLRAEEQQRAKPDRFVNDSYRHCSAIVMARSRIHALVAERNSA